MSTTVVNKLSQTALTHMQFSSILQPCLLEYSPHHRLLSCNNQRYLTCDSTHHVNPTINCIAALALRHTCVLHVASPLNRGHRLAAVPWLAQLALHALRPRARYPDDDWASHNLWLDACGWSAGLQVGQLCIGILRLLQQYMWSQSQLVNLHTQPAASVIAGTALPEDIACPKAPCQCSISHTGVT